eukprot:TRINITY_DN5133_c0_g1_i1.p2 TRINITY_DN5133_c0_g1~~TRINITY_DN5133_c0_g1_i1.p2  ORF type:complete len:59 (+),score=6.38 TRINITY_DN5133_c0_g1_i1:171-347(+)
MLWVELLNEIFVKLKSAFGFVVFARALHLKLMFFYRTRNANSYNGTAVGGNLKTMFVC